MSNETIEQRVAQRDDQIAKQESEMVPCPVCGAPVHPETLVSMGA